MDDITRSNSLTDLAARIRIEHEATADSLRRSIEHAMTAGDLLIEAKAQVKHGEWLPWLDEHCGMAERTAQLYMRIAKGREVIESKIRSGVADLSLNQAAALLVLTSKIDALLDFAKQLQDATDSDTFLQLCLDHDVGVISTPGYDMFGGRTDEEKREWHVFMLFLAQTCGWSPKNAFGHVEWLCQRPFQNVADWLGADKWRASPFVRMRPIPAATKAAWATFAAAHTEWTLDALLAELENLAQIRK
jgi:hypothetical protein